MPQDGILPRVWEGLANHRGHSSNDQHHISCLQHTGFEVNFTWKDIPYFWNLGVDDFELHREVEMGPPFDDIIKQRGHDRG